jgi:hypothetical protein
MSISEELKEETEKWLNKIENLEIIAKSEKGEELKRNIEAYISDCRYFLQKGDLTKAFEAIVWAWAFLEISKELGLLKLKN